MKKLEKDGNDYTEIDAGAVLISINILSQNHNKKGKNLTKKLSICSSSFLNNIQWDF